MKALFNKLLGYGASAALVLFGGLFVCLLVGLLIFHRAQGGGTILPLAEIGTVRTSPPSARPGAITPQTTVDPTKVQIIWHQPADAKIDGPVMVYGSWREHTGARHNMTTLCQMTRGIFYECGVNLPPESYVEISIEYRNDAAPGKTCLVGDVSPDAPCGGTGSPRGSIEIIRTGSTLKTNLVSNGFGPQDPPHFFNFATFITQ